ALLLSSGSINQMLVRAFYLNKFEEHRSRQAEEIRQTTIALEESRQQLTEAREKNEAILSEIRRGKKKLAEKRDQQAQNVKLLRQDREQIEEQLAEVKQQKDELDSTLTSLIMEEERVRKAMEERIRKLEEERQRKLTAAKSIENETERAREMAKYSEPIRREDYITEERLHSLEQSFANQKGQLRWPVESSTISEHFGRRRHPVYGTVTENLGVEIVTKPRDAVRVVHDGYVVAVQPLPGYGDVVVVKHGKYITAYGNLSQVMVRKNTVLNAGDMIGLSGDENSARGESVFFMVREGNNNLNPEAWLANK
ncbi:MAG: peptidoglycan DD-metalloendopeptidase family protein, partial [Balneolaceae bacterium]|nr:peptidoglycan DD-metalloendopeptidase family protein [Balneolaceae bacterium]